MILNTANIRNFCVISHIDHGKTTLTDRFLGLTHTVAAKDMTDRLLDSNPIEQERGITIKLAPVRMHYSLNSVSYILNLIDTPGHVDFSYEVSRSLAACEGAVLLVDATQGIQAQTMANAAHALAANLTIIPVVNKIDLDFAETAKVINDLCVTFNFKPEDILCISAKTGQNVPELLEAIINRIPAPKGDKNQPLQALVFNSFYHPHHGVIASVRVINGQIQPGTTLQLMATQTSFTFTQIGYFTPKLTPSSGLNLGEVGFIATGLKDLSQCRPGDTITSVDSPAAALPGYFHPQPMVFMDLYPINNQDFIKLKTSLDKLRLVDSSLTFEPVSSAVLGSGYKVGFQGLLHADVVQERLEREFDLDLVITNPSVAYQVELNKDRQVLEISSPVAFPDPTLIAQIREPFINVTIFTPLQYLGKVMDLCRHSRCELADQQFFSTQVKLLYHMPLQELISDFFGQLKSVSSGFASLDWQFLDFRPADVVKLEVLLNRQPTDPLARLTIRSKAQSLAQSIATHLKKVIPRQQFEVPIQVCLGGHILARETIKAFRKDVTVKLHAADLGRKNKLLEKQRRGKKRMKRVGKIDLPQEAFLSFLQR